MNCKIVGCEKKATYGYRQTKEKEYCKKHKKEKMILISNNFCLSQNCYKYASFGYENQIKEYCSEHKKPGMINKRTQLCKKCSNHALYNFSFGDVKNKKLKPAYCSVHRESGMVRIKGQYCVFENCQKQASFGYKGKNRKYCKEHRKSTMIAISGTNCLGIDCELRASFGYLNQPVLFCSNHKLENMIHFSQKNTINENSFEV